MKTEKVVLWAIIGVLLLAVVYTVFFSGGSSIESLSASSGQAAQAYSGMVGGC
jgi:hypothetical protein